MAGAAEADEFVFFDARDAALPPVDEVTRAARIELPLLWGLSRDVRLRASWPPPLMLCWQKSRCAVAYAR